MGLRYDQPSGSGIESGDGFDLRLGARSRTEACTRSETGAGATLGIGAGARSRYEVSAISGPEAGLGQCDPEGSARSGLKPSTRSECEASARSGTEAGDSSESVVISDWRVMQDHGQKHG